ncbi:DUF2142 domain-containing protein [Candidatus Amarolinea dominans]|uniref:glycosyltransferase family 39 protein n=1 Tax=Candidatus Amarolinea dominans TaxID=3140696 RepID=UPI001D27714A|nr:glycosyltransferase family 39 protein [Anaerolineae bacterium]
MIFSVEPRRGLAVILLLFVLVAGNYSVTTPAFEAPDEIWHMAFVQHVASGQGLPVSAPQTTALWRQQGVQSPLYYLAAAGLTAWVATFRESAVDQSDFPTLYARANPHAAIGQPDAVANRNYLIHHDTDRSGPGEAWPWRGSILALHLVRFFSILLGALAIWATYQTLALIVGAQPALLGAALVAFIPQFVFISAAASNDNAINALAALVLWRVVHLVAAPVGQTTALRLKPFVILGILLGLALLTKLSSLGLVAVTGLALLIVAWRRRSGRTLIAGGLALAAPAVAISGWWFVRNWLLYRDPLAWNIWQANILLRVAQADWRTILGEMQSLERSFWGLFGWLNLPYPTWVYTALRGLEIVIGLGLLLALWQARAARRKPSAVAPNRPATFLPSLLPSFLLMLWLALLIFSWLRFMVIAPAAQGRYFFPAAPTLGLLLLMGLRGLHGRLGWLVASGLFLLSALTPFALIAPAYRPPPSIGAANLAALQVNLGTAFAIEGVAATSGQVQPGDVATVTVRWRALAPNARDYSIFIHLVSNDGLTVAQTDTMPGAGLLPTSQWTPGQTYTEAYQVHIPATTYTPDQAHWAVGLYDHATGQRLPVMLMVPGADSRVAADSLIFGAVALVPQAGAAPNAMDIAFLDHITLVGYSLSSRLLLPGDPLTVTLYWQARGPVASDYTTFVHLLGPPAPNPGGSLTQGSDWQTFGGHDGVPQPATRAWAAGDIITDTHTLAVSAQARPGVYQLEIGLYTQPDFDRLSLVSAPGAEGADRLLLGGLRVVSR